METLQITPLLQEVEKPAQYVGDEINSIHKRLNDETIRYAWCFPDLYEIGMSHLGSLIMYHLLNEEPDIYCERSFTPAADMESALQRNNFSLFSLETHTPLRNFDFIGFTLQYELSYTNILHMMNLAKIPLLTQDRSDKDPIIMMGGPCAYNPEPMADFADLIVIGEAEEVILEVMELYRSHDKKRRSKAAFLKDAASMTGIYVPSLYHPVYNTDGTINEIKPCSEEIPTKIKKRFIKNLDQSYFPTKPIVPFVNVVHDRATIELFRGCIRGCRFCQAGIIYRPVREKNRETLETQAKEIIDNTGYDELSLTSLSTSDYSQLQKLSSNLTNCFESKHIGLSLPSLRLDNMTLEILKEVQKVRKSGLTFAPEAGSQRMRDVINKGIEEADLFDAVKQAYEAGWSHIKLYFMIGLPTETDEDVEAIYQLVSRLDHEIYQKRDAAYLHPLKISVSVSNFVPKPFTPFQWVPQDSLESLQRKHQLLKDKFRKRRSLQMNYHDAETSILEGVFARGDRRLSSVLIKAYQSGCKLDGWAEHFQFNRWLDAFKSCSIDPYFYNGRKRSRDEILPWDHLDVQVTKSFLFREYEKSIAAETTPHCRSQCNACGFQNADMGGVCP